jgi:hypothetical protein
MATVKKEVKVVTGDVVNLKGHGRYIVAQVDNGVFALISLRSGNRWSKLVADVNYHERSPIGPLLGGIVPVVVTIVKRRK